jgi:branched-chain amino acid transport system substrate-binding protein
MSKRIRVVLAGLALTTVAAAGCSSSSKSSTSSATTAHPAGSSGSSGSSGPTYTIGVLADLTGPGSNTGDTTEAGVKSGIGVAGTEGYHIKYVIADTGTSPTGALNAAKTLVEQDHVLAVDQISVVGFAAAPYLASQGIPVIGANVDGPEWITDRNMFSVLGYQDYTKVQTTYGDVMKKLGMTKVGAIAYGIEPASYDVVKSWAASAQLAGLQVGYLDTQLPFGDTNMGPVALQMKSAGVDGIFTGVVTNTSFALVAALEQQGVKFKGIMATGYGGDLTGGGPGASNTAQGLYFLLGYEPVEMHTAATEKFSQALQQYASVTTEPTLSEYLGYLSIDALVSGLKLTGPNPSHAALINAMDGITNYAAAGLWGGHTASFAPSSRGTVAGADNCTWIVQYNGSSFHLVSGLDPQCGSQVPGKSI